MAKFAKVKNVVTKSIRFLLRKVLIVFQMLLIAWIFLLCFVKLQADPPADMNNKPIKVACNNIDRINYPMHKTSNSTIPQLRSSSLINVLFAVTGILPTFIISIFLSFIMIKSRSKPPITRFFFQFLLWILSLFTGSAFVWLWMMNDGPSETLAPNFLAACKPHGLDVLCSPDSHLDRDRVVWVTCTTPAELWIPTLSNSLPPLAAVQAYLMFSAVLQMIYYWKWEKGQAVLILFYVAVGIFFTVAIGCFVILTNVANFDKEFVSGYLKSCALAFDSFWQTTQNEQQLPRYWNDPTPQKLVKSLLT
jgi:hypothetical protein